MVRGCDPYKVVQNHLFVCVDVLCPSQQFFSHVGMLSVFLGCVSTKQRIKCLAQVYNTVPLNSLKLATLRSH